MTFISYAQNFEDVVLWRALKHIEQGFYIDIGAAWPNEHSVTKAFYDRGWHGINVEPNPGFNAELCRHRPRDINLKVAVGDQEGEFTLHLLTDTGLSTLDDGIAQKHQAAGWTSERQEVEVKTLAAIWQAHVAPGQAVHFLKVDVEGFEEAALKGNDWQNNRPWVVVVEATLPMSQVECHQAWEPILLNAGYQLAYADGLNRFYVAQEHAELLPAFQYPPNVFDDFRLIAQQDAEVKAQQAEAKAQQAEAKAQQAEAKAQQAEAKAQQAEARLNDLLLSTSWRITAPFRWFAHQVRLLRQHGLQSRCKSLLKKILRRVSLEVMKRPGLRRPLLVVSQKTGLYAYLKRVQFRLFGIASFSGISLEAAAVPSDAKDLSPYARQIYARLKIMSLQEK